VSSTVLRISELNVFYGQAHTLHDISLDVGPEDAVFVLGLNGMGKTTLLRAIMGLTPPRADGSVSFNGQEIIHMRPNEIALLGLGYVPQGRLLFPSLSVAEHLTLFYRNRNEKLEQKWTPESVYELFPVLRDRSKISGTLLSGGEQQMLAIGRALVTNPKILIMDEPTEGLSPVIIHLILEICRKLRETGVGSLLSEQNMEVAAALADRALILETGRFVHESNMKDFANANEFKDDMGKYLQF